MKLSICVSLVYFILFICLYFYQEKFISNFNEIMDTDIENFLKIFIEFHIPLNVAHLYIYPLIFIHEGISMDYISKKKFISWSNNTIFHSLYKGKKILDFPVQLDNELSNYFDELKMLNLNDRFDYIKNNFSKLELKQKIEISYNWSISIQNFEGFVIKEVKEHKIIYNSNVRDLQHFNFLITCIISAYLLIIFAPTVAYEMYIYNKSIAKTQQENNRKLLHDLKTPIACIQSIISEHDNKLVKTMSTILTNRIQTINTTKIIPAFEFVNSTEYFEFIYKTYKPLFTNIKDIEFIFVNESTVTSILLDKDWTMRCIENCISNSIKFTKKGYVKLVISNDESMFSIQIIDTGKGIPTSEYRKVLENGYQLQKSTGGIGIGLDVIKMYMDTIKGNVSINNNSPGTIIEMKFPIIDAFFVSEIKSENENKNENEFFENNKKKEILFIEDDKVQQTLIMSIFSYMTNITICNDGLEGLECCQCKNYDTIITDMQMPIMDGIEFIKKLHNHGLQKNAKKIIYTAGYNEIEMDRKIDYIFFDKTRGFQELMKII